MSSSPAIWYAARASGVAAYVVLSIVVSLGLALGGKAQNRRWPRFSVEDIHRFGGLLVGSLIGVHVLAIAADSFLPFSLTQLIVPFTSSYRPFWTGLGICAKTGTEHRRLITASFVMNVSPTSCYRSNRWATQQNTDLARRYMTNL